jgi:hypothetical protein
MKINITAYLFSPTTHLYVSGTNYHVFRFTGEIEIELNPEFLQELIPDVRTRTGGSQLLKVHNETCKIASYSALTNAVIVNGHMKSLDKDYIKSLINTGWVVFEAGAKHHGVKIPRNVSPT